MKWENLQTALFLVLAEGPVLKEEHDLLSSGDCSPGTFCRFCLSRTHFFTITSCNLPLVAKASLPANSIVTLSAAAIITEFIPAVNLFSFMLFLLIQLL